MPGFEKPLAMFFGVKDSTATDFVSFANYKWIKFFILESGYLGLQNSVNHRPTSTAAKTVAA